MILSDFDRHVATAILGIDTLWGGDVLNPSGTGRFIADSWFSDESLPRAYTSPAAATLRALGGVSENREALAALDEYLHDVDVRGALAGVAREAKRIGGSRGAFLDGLAVCCEVMWDLAMETAGQGPAVPYEKCARAVMARGPEPSDPREKLERVARLLSGAGHPSTDPDSLLAAVDAWRRARLVAKGDVARLGASLIAELEAATRRNLLPYLPEAFGRVPLANVTFLPIEDAWFSGSMNYLGRAREKGAPLYEATYELNASLEISLPEFRQLVAHEVVPGHVTTCAFLQNLFVRDVVGFEASVLTMNTRHAALCEGVANNALLIALGATSVEDVEDDDLAIGLLLAQLQDDAKNQASWLTWAEGQPQPEIAGTLRRDYLVSEERAERLSGDWGRHPLLGRMALPAYRFGSERVADLRRRHEPARVLPALFGAGGLVDAVTVGAAISA